MAQEDMSEDQIKKVESDLKIKYKPGEGVLITNVLEGGAAEASSIKAGDVITKFNGTAVKSAPELQEQVSKYKPGDKITLTIKRNDKETNIDIVLKAKLGNTDIAKSSKLIEKLGGKIETLDKATADKNEVNGGVVVKELGNGVLGKSSIEKGFVILTVNDKEVTNLNEFYDAINKSNGSVKLGGFYPGYYGNYAFILNLKD
jgi:S1-C subfamily serine protease